MTAITGTRRHRSLLSLAAAVLNARAQSRGDRFSQLAAALKSHFMTFAACTLVDLGFFHLGLFAGFVVTGLSLIVIDAKVQEG